MKQDLWTERFDFLSAMSQDERNYFLQSAPLHEVRAGQVIAEDNSSTTGIVFVLSGKLKVYKLSENGRELSLYDVRPGEIAMLALSCVLGVDAWPAHVSVSASQDSVIGILPCNAFNYLYTNSPALQRFVFSNIFQKFGVVIHLVEKLTFESVRDRLLDYIRENTEEGKKPLYVTHAQLAARLGTSREVVTRHLRQMSAEGLVAAERGKVMLLKGVSKR